jgi:hypothetical protein
LTRKLQELKESIATSHRQIPTTASFPTHLISHCVHKIEELVFLSRICTNTDLDLDPTIYFNADSARTPGSGFTITVEVKIPHFFFPFFQIIAYLK